MPHARTSSLHKVLDNGTKWHSNLLYRICLKKVKGKDRYSSSWEPHLRAMGRHLPCGITQCYLPPDTSERAPPNPSHAGWYLPRRDGRLSWPSWLGSALAGSWTSDLSITSPTPNHGITKTRRTCHNNKHSYGQFTMLSELLRLAVEHLKATSLPSYAYTVVAT